MEIKNFLEISILISAFSINLLLAAVVYKSNPKSATNKILSVLCLVTATWLIVVYLPLLPIFSSMSLFLIRLSIFLAVPQVALFFILANTIPNSKTSLSFRNLKILLISTIATMLLTLSPLTFTGLNLVNGSPSPTVGLGMLIFLPVVLFLSFGATYSLFKRMKKSFGIEQQQLRFILYGILLMLGLIIFTILIPVAFFNSSIFVPFTPIYVLLFLGMTSYAIVKHRLMDIRVVVARTVSFTLLMVLFAFVYALAFSIPTWLLASTINKGQAVMISTALAVIMAFSFQPLRKILEEISDKSFFTGRYDSSKLLAHLGSIMSVNIELDSLTSKIIQTLIEQMRISKGAFVILGEEATVIYDVFDLGFDKKLSLTFNQITPFLSTSRSIIFDELEENNLKSLMRDIDISVIKTLIVKGQPVGILLLGGKASGEIYSDQDLKIIEILAPEVSVAIQNSQSYDKIKRFNVTLTQEVQRATVDLKHANERLRQLDQLKDDFVSIASHELRTPMTAIRSYAWMALHKSDVPLSKTLEKYIVRVLLSTERLINLVNDMLNVSRIESGKIEINPEPVDLISLSKDIVDELYYSKSQEKEIQFLVLEKQIPKVLADPEKLRQVFLNLVGNSLKFTPHGGKITFDFFCDGQVVETHISDTGVGISNEDLSKLFHKFSRLDNSYTAAATSGGTGLGLYISKNLIDLMHGRIWAQSEGVNKGTTFSVSLPVATSENLKQIEKFKVIPKGEVKKLEPASV